MNSYNACLAMFRLVHQEQKKPRMLEHLAPHIIRMISSREMIQFTYNKTLVHLAQHTAGVCVFKSYFFNNRGDDKNSQPVEYPSPVL